MKDIKLSKQEITEGAPFAVLSYVLFLWILTFILKKDNEDMHGLLLKAGILLKQDKLNEAKIITRKIYDKDPDNLENVLFCAAQNKLIT